MIKEIENNYGIKITKFIKNEESTIGNVYIIYTNNNKYVLKIYDDINLLNSMISIHDNISKYMYVPSIVKTISNKSYIRYNNKYLLLYTFLEGIQIEYIDRTPNIIKELGIALRNFHDYSKENIYNLSNVPSNKLNRKSLLHFDLTKSNIFYNNKIGFIDFDDAKYGDSIYDVAILICNLFFSKTRGIDKEGIKLFLDSYYGNDNMLKEKEIDYINKCAIYWIDLVTGEGDFNSSTKESFDIKKKMLQEFDFKSI